MNTRDKDVLLALSSREYSGQRDLAELLGCSLGAVNMSLHTLLLEEYIDEKMRLTAKSRSMIRESSPKRAVLLAAGTGIRMSPMQAEKPKPLLEIGGEALIERIIKQLHEAGIYEIYAVVGYAKEQFEYLIDDYGVKLIVNPEYAGRNNLHSLALAKEHLKNSYVVPCDIRFGVNPFRAEELYSWYAVSDSVSRDSSVRVNRKRELAVISDGLYGNNMIGISYLLKDDAEAVGAKLEDMDRERRYKGAFWEETLYEGDKLRVASRVLSSKDFSEINSAEDLWELDSPKEIPLTEISGALGVREDEITDISLLKKGSTNRSFLFDCRGERYILRIPYDEVNRKLDHRNEAAVYAMLSGKGLSDEAVYLNGVTGVKISKYMENIRFCDPYNESDVKNCMRMLRSFHSLHLTSETEFDLFGTAEYFESLWEGTPSVYRDYQGTKENVFSLREYIDSQKKDCCLTHIDAVPDNFLIFDNNGSQNIRLIDWEYAAMQDPDLDIAMFALYALYDRDRVDSLIQAYFPEGCSDEVRLKIYCYISVGGLLWSNWCEYRQKNGTEFGEYSLRQYRYAKEYYRIVKKELQK